MLLFVILSFSPCALLYLLPCSLFISFALPFWSDFFFILSSYLALVCLSLALSSFLFLALSSVFCLILPSFLSLALHLRLFFSQLPFPLDIYFSSLSSLVFIPSLTTNLFSALHHPPPGPFISFLASPHLCRPRVLISCLSFPSRALNASPAFLFSLPRPLSLHQRSCYYRRVRDNELKWP